MLKDLTERYPLLKSGEAQIEKAIEIIGECYEKGGKLLLCGNGGSSADCEHISGELMKGFLKKRPLSAEKKAEMKERCPLISDETLELLQCGLPAISLPSLTAVSTAYGNDVSAKLIYAQTVFALSKKEDVLFAISTSGNSENVVEAAKVAKGLGIKVVSLSGKNGGKLKELSDVCICADETETYKIQELHLPIYHYICKAVEEWFFEV